MKNKILFALMIILFKLNIACPVYHKGDFYVVNEENLPLNANVWCVYCSSSKNTKDSFLINDKGHWSNVTKKYDTVMNRRCIYDYMLYNRLNRELNYIRIQHNGYADLVLKKINFVNSWTQKMSLTLKMYKQSYHKIEKNISLISEYVCDKSIEIRDSVVIDKKDYLQSIIESAKTKQANDILLVETYPNPVVEQLYIDIHCKIIEPWSVQITNETGKKVLSKELTESKNVINLNEIPVGTYILVVYNQRGIAIYSRKFLFLKT